MSLEYELGSMISAGVSIIGMVVSWIRATNAKTTLTTFRNEIKNATSATAASTVPIQVNVYPPTTPHSSQKQ